jgi:NAD(P)-dependent dehydrogenase (short-subunit alcohol dehydrogenase family)
MDYGLKGKIALVTGTASQTGMGNAICVTLAKEGCDIVSADIDLEGAQKTADAIKILGRKAIAVKVNITKGSEVDEMVNTALKKFGKIDILVNTAGLSAMSGVPFLESKQEAWEKDLAVNLYGTMNCVKAVIPGMVEHKYGKIINFSSIVAKIGVDLTSYAAAKAAVSAFTRGLAVQYGPSGIYVNAVATGMVKTSFFAKWEEKPLDQLFAAVASTAPLRRNQTVEDIANAVAFLASDVSKNITGQVLHVDSGMVML